MLLSEAINVEMLRWSNYPVTSSRISNPKKYSISVLKRLIALESNSSKSEDELRYLEYIMILSKTWILCEWDTKCGTKWISWEIDIEISLASASVHSQFDPVYPSSQMHLNPKFGWRHSPFPKQSILESQSDSSSVEILSLLA